MSDAHKAKRAEDLRLAEDIQAPAEDRLRAAARLYLTDRDDPAAGRYAVNLSLMAVIDIVRVGSDDINDAEMITKPLAALVFALADLDRGTLPPLLKPMTTRGGVPISLSVQQQHGRIAAAVQLRRYGHASESQKDSAAWVARQIREWPIMKNSRRKGSEAWRAVSTWHDDALCGNPDEDGVAATYRGALNAAIAWKTETGASDDDAAKHVLTVAGVLRR